MNIKHYRRILLAITILMGALAASLFLSTTSIADPSSGGAYVAHDAYCFDIEDQTFCYTNFFMVTGTITPSGNTIFVGNGRSSYSQMDSSGNVVYADSIKYHTQGAIIDDVLKDFGQFWSTSTTYNGITWCTQYLFHFANDNTIQFDRWIEPCNN